MKLFKSGDIFMAKFRVGDRIKVIKNITNLSAKDLYIGEEHTIKNIQSISDSMGQSYGIGQTFVVYEKEIVLANGVFIKII